MKKSPFQKGICPNRDVLAHQLERELNKIMDYTSEGYVRNFPEPVVLEGRTFTGAARPEKWRLWFVELLPNGEKAPVAENELPKAQRDVLVSHIPRWTTPAWLAKNAQYRREQGTRY